MDARQRAWEALDPSVVFEEIDDDQAALLALLRLFGPVERLRVERQLEAGPLGATRLLFALALTNLFDDERRKHRIRPEP